MSVVPRNRGRAIVIGGSMAGLLAARTLADHFRDVLLLERDELRDSVEHRRGVPQGRHSHVLLASGSRVLESLFPGICRELEEAGATNGDVGRSVRWFLEGARLIRCTSSIEGFGMSRPFLERIVRARVRQVSRIRVRDTVNVEGLCVSQDHRRVIGVRAGGEEIFGDFIVDASGRGSRSPQWLEDIGYKRPREERVGIDLRYTTRLFAKRPLDLNGDNAVIVPPTPIEKRGGGMIRQEGDCWIVTLITHFGEFPPPDLSGFREFARTLPVSDIYDIICDAEPIGGPETIRIPASVRHRYERLKRFPAGYLVVGDAISSFNPIYGQGMSVAALQAAQLGAVLNAAPRDPSKRFFRRAAKIVDAAWSISAGNDLRMPEATGHRNVVVALVNWYVKRVLQAGHRDSFPARAFLNVSNLVAPPLSLAHPSVVWRVLRSARVHEAGRTGFSRAFLRNLRASFRRRERGADARDSDRRFR